MPITLTDPAQLATPLIRRGEKKDGGKRNDRGKEKKKKEREGEDEENAPNCTNGDETETQMATAMFFHPLQDFFFPTRLSATDLSTTAVPRRGHWGLQLGPAVRGLREDLPGHDGLSQKGGGKNTALSPDPWTETRTGRSSQHRMPIHKGTPPPPPSPAMTRPPIKT